MNDLVAVQPISREEKRSSSQSLVSARPRLVYIDNLRWTMIILVISMHAADTYSPFGNWYFVDRLPVSISTVLFFAAWQMYLQSFFMGLLFFIAGYFVPPSFQRKGPTEFLHDRAIRLGLPVLLYMFLIGPFTEYYVAHSWNSTEPTSFTNEWVKHIQNGQFLQENGPLWFCLALLLFSAAYALLRLLGLADGQESSEAAAPTNGTLVGFALTMAAFSFCVRIGRPPSFLNMHLADFPQYILLFSAGVSAASRGWLSKLSFEKGMRWLVLVLSGGFAVWLTLMGFVVEVQKRGEDLSGGWHWQSAVFCLWESFTCVALSFGLLVLYRRMFNSQGRLAKFLSANAFSVYVFHPPVLIVVARLMHALQWQPLVKFGFLTLASATATFGLSSVFFRRVPLLRRIL